MEVTPIPYPLVDPGVETPLPAVLHAANEDTTTEPKKVIQHPPPGKKRKLAHSRSATPGSFNGDEQGGGGDSSRRSSETPVSHRYAVTGPDEDARLKTVAKMGTKVLGSGDGQERGEECFFWTDLPMNRLGAFFLDTSELFRAYLYMPYGSLLQASGTSLAQTDQDLTNPHTQASSPSSAEHRSILSIQIVSCLLALIWKLPNLLLKSCLPEMSKSVESTWTGKTDPPFSGCHPPP
jgi:hypothetical protein